MQPYQQRGGGHSYGHGGYSNYGGYNSGFGLSIVRPGFGITIGSGVYPSYGYGNYGYGGYSQPYYGNYGYGGYAQPYYGGYSGGYGYPQW